MIPAIIFITVVYFSGTNEMVVEKKSHPQDAKLVFKKDHDINFSTINSHQDENDTSFSTIYNFITKKFTKIEDEDAKKISRNLVDYGEKYKLDPKLAAAVIARESSFNKAAVSETGAKGLGQIKEFNFKDLSINDPFNIDQNVSGTVQYLQKMIKNWKNIPENTTPTENEQVIKKDERDIKLALASYFKGFTAVKNRGVDEKTQEYVEDIIEYYKEIIDIENKNNASN